MNKAHHAEKVVQTAATDGSRGDRLGALRSRFIELGLGGFLIPHADAHQSEYLPPGDERLAWISGFTGSAGAAIVLEGAAAVFVDGRYTLQAKMQVERDLFEICHLAEDPPAAWLERNAAPDTKIGYDPWHYTKSQLQRFRQAAGKAGAALVPVAANPIDHVWADRPAAPASPVVAHEARFAGKSSAEKRSEIAAVLAEDRDRAVILTAADSIAWLFNIRGADVEHSPLPISFAALEADGTARLFVDPGRLASPVRDHLEAIRIDAPDALGPYLDGLGGDKARVRICPATAAVWLFDRLQKAGAELHEAPDPCSLPKAVKNDIELEGTRSAHLRDGLALVRFLAWLDAQVLGSVDELGAAERLEALRREGEFFQGLSFPTISGAGANGAIVHYRVTPETNAILAEGLYLVDSGAQYLDGTTDVTRTVAVGGPTDDMRRHFTLVLKGHIAMATARFPAGTRGSQLDALARQYLWQAGLDYDHGTGHGVGSYLGVHEGPQRISKTGGDAGLKRGMIVSNEPGFYKEGAYGIRIENLVEVIALSQDGGPDFLGFRELTRAPIDRRLIEVGLLSETEMDWLDAYHETVLTDIGPNLDPADLSWLEAATAPLDRPAN